ncbi:hypothetical protein PspR84_17265 [Pseudomonas sp. R84]|uniref:hypothetical protein n=1 Tax=Pseudomonas sp. R84 TaxID=1573712 RepID=UPI00131FB18F|nr:hypothetical protein [Pseudomonas sp. R84]QHC96311.1 hypothetical protein PspR84_17265 [Pseudomonas sp. R84]
MDLFNTKLPQNKLHASFKEICSDPNYTPVKDVIQSWSKGLLERSGEQVKFINEFQTTFNSSFWELYLNKMIMELGFAVDYTKASPDFCVSTPSGYQFNVEAVISDRPKATTTKKNSLNEKEFRDHCTFKLIGKIKDKRDIFSGVNGKQFPYSSLGHVRGRPFVIAIAPFDSDLSLTQNNEIINRVLFGIEPPDAHALKTGKQRKISSISKPSGAPVELGIFTNDSYKEISAVIFSTTGTFGKAVVESGVERIVRATIFREINKNEPAALQGFNGLGINNYQIGPLNYLISTRYDFGSSIAGSDIHIYHSSYHRETHLDGLHIYYNPYATIPFEADTIDAKEVTHNFYDINTNSPIQYHPDGALVSRQLYEPTINNLKFLLDAHSKEVLTSLHKQKKHPAGD